MEMNEQHEAWMNRLLDAWNRHDVQAAADFCSADYYGIDVSESSPQEGPQGLQASMARYLDAFPDLSLVPVEVVADGERIAMRWVARGTHRGWIMNIPPTGKRVAIAGTWFLTLADGKIQQATSVWDVAGLLRTIGLLPELQ